MYKLHTDRRQLVSYDGYALSMWHTVQKAVAEWIEERARAPEKVSRWFLVKLNFAFSDVLRFASVNMRYAAYCGGLSAMQPTEEQRVLINANEMAAGLRKWFRQLALHQGYYMYMKGNEAAVAKVPGRPEQALADELENAAPVRPAKPALAGLDAVKYEILTDPKLAGDSFETSFCRNVIKGRLPNRGGEKLSENIHKACDELVQAGLLQPASPESVGRRRARRLQPSSSLLSIA